MSATPTTANASSDVVASPDMCNCNEAGYSELPSTDSWNENCSTARQLFLLFLLSLALLATRRKHLVTLSLALLAYLFYRVYQRPSTLLHAPSALLTSSIRTPEFLDLSLFPHHKLFEKDFSLLKEEVSHLLLKTRQGKDLTLTRDTYSGENAYIGSDVKVQNGQTTGWRVLPIKTGSSFSAHATHFPTLKRILRRCPDVVACVISVLEPGVTIPIHNGYYKGIMRYMIPTHVPQERDKVFLCVNGKKYHWTEGKSVLWDDNFPHKVYNYSDEIRVVIYMDVIRPLSGLLNSFNRSMLNIAANSRIVKKEIERTEKQIKLS
jgi:ornithine lipid ester-linked acyl 2-hydroxylase